MLFSMVILVNGRKNSGKESGISMKNVVSGKGTKRRLLAFLMAVVMILGSVGMDGTSSLRRVLAAGEVTDDMKKFITAVEVDSGGLGVYAGTDYQFSIFLMENNSYQFDDTLTMQLPMEITGETFNGKTDINVSVGGITYTVSENEYTVTNDTITLQLNTGHENYTHLAGADDAKIQLDLRAHINSDVSEIQWNDEVTTLVEDTPELAIAKDIISWDSQYIASYIAFDEDNSKYLPDVIKYQLTVTTYGTQNNVEVYDGLGGTALSLVDGSVEVFDEAQNAINLEGQVINYADGGFTVHFDKLPQGTYTITYKAAFDVNQVNGNGDDSETRNTAIVTNTDLGISDSDDYSFTGKIKKTFVDKSSSFNKETMTADYTVTLKGAVYSHTVVDTLKTNAQNQKYTGDGITIEIKTADGTSVIPEGSLSVSWEELGVSADSTSWSYTLPDYLAEGYDDGKLTATIRYSTKINTTGQSGKFDVSNQFDDQTSGESDTATITGIGVNPEYNVTKTADKAALGETDDTITWTITLDIPAAGLPKGIVKDTLPSFSAGLVNAYDALDSTPVVSGLLSGETYDYNVITSIIDWSTMAGAVSGFQFEFSYTDSNGDTKSGFAPSDEDRQVVIVVTTNNNSDWPSSHSHTNTVTFDAGIDKSPKEDTASVTPYVNVDLEKNYKKRIESTDGDIYYGYELKVFGIAGDIDITDTYSAYQSFPENYTIVGFSDSYDEAKAQSAWESWAKNFYSSYADYLKASGYAADYDLTPVFVARDEWTTFSADITPVVSDTGSSVNFHIAKSDVPVRSEGGYYSKEDYESVGQYYSLTYWLKVDEEQAYEDSASFDSAVHITNTAVYGDKSDSATVDIQFDALSKTAKSKTDKNSLRSGEIEFTISINPSEKNLSSGDTLTVTDTFTDNFILNINSITAADADGNNVEINYSISGNTITYIVPDSRAVTITYTGLVNVEGEAVTVSNTASLMGYTATAEKTVTRETSGSGSASNLAITLYKHDIADVSVGIPNAKFKLYWTDETDENETIHSKEFTSNADGNVQIILLENTDGYVLKKNKEYYLVETEAPTGYILDPTPHSFTISSDNAGNDPTVYLDGGTMAVGNERIEEITKFYIDARLHKTDDSGNPRSGAVFTLYADSDCTKTIKSFAATDTDGNLIISAADADLAAYLPVDDGNVRYYLKETTAPDGCILDSTIYKFEIISKTTGGWNTEHTKYEATNTYSVFLNGSDNLPVENTRTKVNISKVDVTDGAIPSKLAGATLRLLYEDKSVVLDENGNRIEWTSSDSAVKTIEGLKTGVKYRIHEVTPPTGYKVLTDDIIFEIKADGTVETAAGQTTEGDKIVILAENTKNRRDREYYSGLTVTKTDENDDTKKLKGAEFTLYANAALSTAVKTYTTDSNGVVEISAGENEIKSAYLPAIGSTTTLYLKETKAPDGYVLDTAAAPYEIEISVEKGSESSAPVEGYFETPITYSVKLKEGTTSVSTKDITNQKTSVKVSKVDATNEKEVKDAHIQVIRKVMRDTDNDGIADTEVEEVVTEWDSVVTTDGKGKTVEGLETGVEYTLRETVAPDGYDLAVSDTKFIIKEDGTLDVTAGVTRSIDGEEIILIQDARKKGNTYSYEGLTVTKIYTPDSGSTKKLEGAVFTLYKADKTTKIRDYTTNANGEIEISAGEAALETYLPVVGSTTELFLKETKAPEGYVLDDNAEYTVTVSVEAGTESTEPVDGVFVTPLIYSVKLAGNTTKEVSNDKTVVRVSKVDNADGAELTGAHIQILDENGEAVIEWDSQAGTDKVIEGLKTGVEYTLRETVAPDGYAITTDTTFTIETDGTVTSSMHTRTDANNNKVLLVEDAKTRVNISKVDLGTGEELAGAHIQIIRLIDTDDDGIEDTEDVVEQWDSTVTDDKKGKTVEGLTTEVTYILRETVAPEGYAITTDTKFTLKKDGTIDTDNTTTSTKDVTTGGETTKVLLVEDTALSFRVNKVELGGGEEVEGAELVLYEIEKDSEGNLVTDSDGSYVLVKDANGNDKVIDSWTSQKGENGEKKTYDFGKKLTAGHEYVLRETVAPVGYGRVTTDMQFEVKTDGTIEVKTSEQLRPVTSDGKTVYLVEDTAISFNVNKVDAGNGEEVEGAELKVYEVETDENGDARKDENGDYIIVKDSEGKEKAIDSWVSEKGENGKIKTHDFGEKLESGKTYILRETVAPDDYARITTDIEIKIMEDGTVEVGLKTTTDDEGRTIYLVENGKKRTVYFTKYGRFNEQLAEPASNADEVEPISGVTFSIASMDNPDDIIATATSREPDGRVEFTGIAPGTYVVKEVSSGHDNYRKLDKAMYVTVTNDGYTGLMETPGDGTAVFEVADDVYRGNIEFTKVNESNPEESLAGSTYGLFRRLGSYARRGSFELTGVTASINTAEGVSGSLAEEAEIVAIDGEDYVLLATATTNAQGKVKFAGVITGVDYMVKELEAPDGFYVSKHPMLMRLSVNDVGTVKAVLVNDGEGTITMDKNGNITWLEPVVIVEVSKVDERDKALSGATLHIEDQDGNVMDSWTSDGSVHRMEGKLISGKTYYLVEDKAPSGYEIAKKISFNVSEQAGSGEEEQNIIRLKMIDEEEEEEDEEDGSTSGTHSTSSTDVPRAPKTADSRVGEVFGGSLVFGWLAISLTILFLKKKEEKKYE